MFVLWQFGSVHVVSGCLVFRFLGFSGISGLSICWKVERLERCCGKRVNSSSWLGLKIVGWVYLERPPCSTFETPALSNVLERYGLFTDGSVEVKKRRLKQFIGIVIDVWESLELAWAQTKTLNFGGRNTRKQIKCCWILEIPQQPQTSLDITHPISSHLLSSPNSINPLKSPFKPPSPLQMKTRLMEI